jgi:predicted methyltransferase
MRNIVLLLAALLAACAMSPKAKGPSPETITAAITDAARPQEDRDRDEHRKPAEMVKFAGIKEGDQVIDLLPGGGYFTRIFSKVAGPKGHVYGWLPSTANPKSVESFNALVSNPAYSNVSLLQTAPDAVAAPLPVDVIWTSQNYHDLHNRGGIAEFNTAVFKALKPSGVFVVLDHTASAGSGDSTSKTLHRIDPELVKKEVVAAGFVYEGSIDVLVNKDDTHALPVFDPSLRGMTDQFVFKFRKPK